MQSFYADAGAVGFIEYMFEVDVIFSAGPYFIPVFLSVYKCTQDQVCCKQGCFLHTHTYRFDDFKKFFSYLLQLWQNGWVAPYAMFFFLDKYSEEKQKHCIFIVFALNHSYYSRNL
jgi:hypothetical protein